VVGVAVLMILGIVVFGFGVIGRSGGRARRGR